MFRKLKPYLRKYYNYYKLFQISRKQKIFVIGTNKTGTTSLKQEFIDRGFVVGNQRIASYLLDDYILGNYKPIIKYCRTAQVFQDFPFSYPETYKHVFNAFPNAKYILSVRDSPEQWYDSLTRFHAKKFGNGNVPTIEDLKNSEYIYKGWVLRATKKKYGTSDVDIFNKEILINFYKKHNEEVRKFFKDSDNFLEINLSSPDSYPTFCKFLDLPTHGKTSFPWKNKTSEIHI